MAPKIAGPVVICVKFVPYYTQGWILEVRYSSQTLRNGTLYFTHAVQKLYLLKASEIFYFVWDFASA